MADYPWGNNKLSTSNPTVTADYINAFQDRLLSDELVIASRAKSALNEKTDTTNTYTLLASDFADTVINFTFAGTVNITLPLDATLGVPIGSGVTFRAMGATTILNVVGATGTTVIPSSGGVISTSQYQMVFVEKYASNSFDVRLSPTTATTGGTGAALAFVRQATPIHDSSNATTRPMTITAPANGNALVLACVSYTSFVTGVTGTGLTFVQAPSAQGAPHFDRGTDGSYVSFWYALNAASAGTTLTITSATAGVSAQCIEVSGLGSTSTPTFYWNDTNGGVSGTANPGPVTGGGKLAMFVMADSLGDAPTAYPSGYTALTRPAAGVISGAYQLSPTSGTPSATLSTTQQFNCAVLTLA